MDSKLAFNAHINSICKKAHSTRQFLQRTLSRCDRDTKAKAYSTFVRPIVDYSCSVWDPSKENKSQAERLESVQNKAVRFAHNNWKRTASVSAMRVGLGWDTLEERRAQARLCMLYKIKHNLVAIPISLFPHSKYIITSCGTPVRFLLPGPVTSGYQRTFMYAAPALWNRARLPGGTIDAPDPETFRSAITGVGLTA